MADVAKIVEKLVQSKSAQRVLAAANDQQSKQKAIATLYGLIPIPVRWFVKKRTFANYVETKVFAPALKITQTATEKR
jgi:hypothetical protein